MKPVLVIGDCCIDRFVHCNCVRLCPEAPVPVLDITDIKESIGMAGNVYSNLQALGVNCELVCNKNYKDVIKARYVDNKTNHMFIRIDTSSKSLKLNKFVHTTRKSFTNNYNKYSAIVISDYNKGFLSEADIEKITISHPLTFLDTKKVLDEWSEQSTFIKINSGEYEKSQDYIESTVETQNKVIKTTGEGGCVYQDKIYPVEKVDIKDLSGAGDTFLAGLVKMYLQTKDIETSLRFANKCATAVVQKKGVCTISLKDLK